MSHLLKLDKAQRKPLTSTVNRMIPASEVRQKTIESLAFENANAQCKRVIRPLKARSVFLKE